MSTTKKRRTLENLSGLGAVYKNDKPIANVRYNIKVEQEIIVSRTASGNEEIPGLKEITGQIVVVDGERDLIDGSVMTLQLTDGRQWEFFASKGDPISGIYKAVNASGDGLKPKQNKE